MGFSRTNLFKRLESGDRAFIQSVERRILRNFVYAHATRIGSRFESLSIRGMAVGLTISAATVLALGGCGGSAAGPPPTPAKLVACLQAKPDLLQVGLIQTRAGGTATPQPATRPTAARASVGVVFYTGGPRHQDGVISEFPLQANELYVFPDIAAAVREAALAQSALARASRSRPSPGATVPPASAEPIGRAVLVHVAGTAFGPGPAVSDQERRVSRDCLKQIGYG